MNIEFHYYILHFLANQAGFEEEDARIIAHSSQFVDHNIISYRIDVGGSSYITFPTQNYGFWDESFPRDVYIPFHFFPGDPEYAGSRRADRKSNPLNCTPNSPAVKELLVSALKTRNLYRVGIALHTYADSWAHQNFTGLLENWNAIDQRSIVPAIGHAQAFRKPDNLDVVWQDQRLNPDLRKINNRKRVFAAAKMIYKFLCTYNRRDFSDSDLMLWKLTELIGDTHVENTRDERIADIVIEENMAKYERSEWLHSAFIVTEDPGDERMFSGYDKFLWLKDAVLYRSSLVDQKPVKAKPSFQDSHFYRWQESARDHLKEAKRILKGRVY